MNHHGCYCKNCLQKYRQYLAARKLKDTPENKTAFYREKLVEYYNRVIDYIKNSHSNYKIVAHIYPDFRNDPLYGNRTKADYCGQTVSWYFKWDENKIRKYTEYVLNHAKDHFPSVEGIPFIGINEAKNSSLAHKTPMEVEQELRIILASGSRTVMVCNGTAILKAGYYEVFKKYCGKEAGKSAPIVVLPLSSETEAVRWILDEGGNVEVLSPRWGREKICTLAKKTAKVNRD